MKDAEINPAPSVPWYRAIVTRTPRGRKLRRRIALVLALVTVPWSLQIVFADPRKLAAKLGLREMPDDIIFQRCHGPSECGTTCAFGGPICLRGGYGSDPKDPVGGICQCLSKEQEAARRQPPRGCKGPRFVRETANGGFDWACDGETDLGGSAIDGGREKEGGP